MTKIYYYYLIILRNLNENHIIQLPNELFKLENLKML